MVFLFLSAFSLLLSIFLFHFCPKSLSLFFLYLRIHWFWLFVGVFVFLPLITFCLTFVYIYKGINKKPKNNDKNNLLSNCQKYDVCNVVVCCAQIYELYIACNNQNLRVCELKASRTTKMYCMSGVKMHHEGGKSVTFRCVDVCPSAWNLHLHVIG